MPHLSATDLLTVWERGGNQPSWRQALLLLDVAFPELSWDDLLKASIGQRDSLLLAVREQIFGLEMLAVVDCPKCQHTLDLNFLTRDIKVEPMTQDIQQFSTQFDEYEMLFRLPNSLDMGALNSMNGRQTQSQLLMNCVERVEKSGDAIGLDELPETAVNHLLQKMSEVDPQAEVLLNVACPDCEHEWTALFDIFSFFMARDSKLGDWHFARSSSVGVRLRMA